MEATSEEHGRGRVAVLNLVGQTDPTRERPSSLGVPGVRSAWATEGKLAPFRRTYASWAHEKGVPGKVVAQLMGHTNADVTINVYTQVMDRSLRDAVATVGRELITIDHETEAIEVTREAKLFVRSQAFGDTPAFVFARSRSYGVWPSSAPCGRW